MAAPVLQTEGATATGVTTGAPSITIPTHQANDILVVCAIAWVPNTVGDAAEIPTPSGWALIGTQVKTVDGLLAWFWVRAAGAGTTVTLTRGASWDTGTDTCFNGRAYVVRGCITTGNPWDAVASAGPYTTANQVFAAVTVSGAERMVVQFGNSTDNAAFAMTSTGWTIGTEDDDTGGTDSAFQTARKDNVSSSTAADAATVAAPAQGIYGFMGISFIPPASTTFFQTIAAISVGAASLTDVEIFVRTLTVAVVGATALSMVATHFYSLVATAAGVSGLARVVTFSRVLAAMNVGTATVSKGMFVGLTAVSVGITNVGTALLSSVAMAATAVGAATLMTALVASVTVAVMNIGVVTMSVATTFGRALAAASIGVASLAAQFIAGGGAVFQYIAQFRRRIGRR